MTIQHAVRSLPASAQVFRAFIGLELAAAAGFTLLLIAALIAPVKRYATWYSFCVSWIISSVSYSLLALAGEQDNPTPGRALCVAQAALIYAAPILTGCTTCALSIQMFLTTRSIIVSGDVRHKLDPTLRLALVMVPYWLWMIMIIAIVTSGLVYSESVVRAAAGNYCDVVSVLPSKISSLVVVIATVVAIITQSFIFRFIYKNRRAFGGGMYSLAMTYRVMFFTFAGSLGLAMSVVYVITCKPGAEFDLVLATLPVFALLIFGSQSDLLRSCLFCRNHGDDQSYSS